MVCDIFYHPIGSIYHLYTTSILPIGWLYVTYHHFKGNQKQPIESLRQKRSRSSQREREGGSSNGWKDGREGQAGDVFHSSDQLGAENWLEFVTEIYVYIYIQNIGI